MIESLQNLYTTFVEAMLQRKSKSLLSTFDRTVKGLQDVSVSAQKLAGVKADQIKMKEVATAKTIEKAKAAERKAIIKAEMKRFTKVDKAETTVAKVTASKTLQINSLTAIAEKNARVAGKLQELVS